jgi:DNA modification methylase
VSLLVKGAEDQSEPWPEADLVFTSPPYAQKECYNCASNDPNDGQAWRLCTAKKFTSHFLEPMMQNAAQSTLARKGRVIINISNTEVKEGGPTLVDDVIHSGEKAGLTLTDIIGLRVGTRSYNKTKDAVPRGDPCLVFEHL